MPNCLSSTVTETAVNLIATGVNHKLIAEQLHIHPKSVQRIKDRQKDRIFAIATEIMNRSADLVKDNHIKTLQAANAILSQAVSTEPDTTRQAVLANLKEIGLAARDLLKIADLKEYRTLQIMGIVPSATQSVIVNQILGNVSVNLVDPGVRSLLGTQLIQLEEDTVEAEVIDSPTNSQ